MAIKIVRDDQIQLAWEREPSNFTEGVTLSHRLHYRQTFRVEEYIGTPSALVKAGLCTEDQLPPEHSVMRTYTPDGKRKKAGAKMEAGSLQIVRAGRSLFRCDKFFALTTQEQNYINAKKERKYKEHLQREKEIKERKLSSHEIKVRMFEEMSNERIDGFVRSAHEWYLMDVIAANEVKAARRKEIAESDGVVIYPKIWQHA